MSRSTAERPFPQLLGDDGSVVVAGDRFGARARARRRRVLGAVVVTVLCALCAGWILTASPWGTVQRLQITGTARIDDAQVRAVAAAELGRPLLLVRTGAVESRVRGLRLVAGATVSRVWPGTLRIVVRERQPVAALPVGGTFRLVDRDGVEVGTVSSAPSSAPPAVPVVQVDLVTAGARAVRSALDSLGVLPPALRAQLRAVGAASGDGVWFRLDDGDTVIWGDASQVDLKVAALDALRRQAGRERAAQRKKGDVQLSKRPVTFDVSAPRAPSVQR